MKLPKILIATAHLFLSSFVQGQLPILKINAKETQQKVALQKLKIDVQITGNTATTTMTMTFYNGNVDVLEGDLTFPLPNGVSVSRYALDINGKMREAVPIEKAKATEVFESIERRRVDPALLEKVEGNNFRTRIYPLPAKGTRTIIVAYEEELHLGKSQMLTYRLPLDYNQTISDFSLKITVFNSVLKPDLVEQPDGSFTLKPNGNTYVAEMKKADYQPKNALQINLPIRSDMPEVQMQKANSGYYFLVNVFPKTSTRPRIWSDQIGVIWDVSLSGLHKDIKKEIELLGLIIKQKQNLTIHLGLLNNTFSKAGIYTITNGNWEALKSKLENLVYDGGTNFSAINTTILPANEYLFFTEGISTFGKNNVALNKPVHTINSAQKADYSTLKYISLKTGGQFINLNTFSVRNAFERLNKEQLQYLGIKNNDEVRQTYPSMKVNVEGYFSLTGILSQFSTNIVLQFGYGNTVVSEQKIRLNPAEQPLTSVAVSKIWAQKKIAEMDIKYEENKDDISVLSKQFGIVTRNTSLIVLENLDDYLRYDIVPPLELRSQYDAILKQRSIAMLARKTDLLNQSFSMVKDLKSWWATDFIHYKTKSNNGNYPIPEPVMDAATYERPRGNNVAEQVSNLSTSDKISSAPMTEMRRTSGNAKSKDMETRSTNLQSVFINQPEIKIAAFKSDKNYMKSLTGKGEELYQEYLKIRPKYSTTPQFYFDVANHFYQQQDSVRALRILSNIADLELENADLYKVMSYKLKQTKNYGKALFITEKVLQWRPMDAQSYRDYALALADIGDYQKALDNLYKVLTQTYNTETANRDEGIEEIIIAEINNLISLHSDKLNLKGIDKRLILALPVDIRVVLNWNKNNTDIDLWLTDPNGEKCYYSHPKTAIGGRLSNDFTSGYGPEQFMLKKAIKGKYKIEVDYYGDTQFTISGPTTVTAEIYTKYATGKQQRKIIVVPLEGDSDRTRLVGEFVF